jgi:hypothetical protein
MTNNPKRIRIFVAAPADARPERECLESVIKELKQPGRLASQIGVELKLYDWGASLADFKKRKAGLDFDELPLKQWDLFVGILRFGFDNPVEEDSVQEREKELSAVDKIFDESAKGSAQEGEKNLPVTEDVFDYAYKAWKRTGKPEILLFRSHRSFSPTQVDEHQRGKVQEFFDKFIADTKNQASYKIFKETDKFKEILERDLSNYLKKFELNMLLSEKLRAIEKEIYPGETPEGRKEEGRTHEMVFLRVSSLLHNSHLKDQPTDKIVLLLKNYYDFTMNIVNEYKGSHISWNVEGGVWVFWGKNSYERAVEAGIELTDMQKEFNENRRLNPFEVNLKSRMAAHCGSLEIGSPTKHLYARSRNYVTYIEKNNTPPGTFVTTDILYHKISDQFKEKLGYERNYEHHALYSYRLSSKKPEIEPLSDTELERIKTKIEDNIESLSENLQIATRPQSAEPDYEEMRGYVERIYRNYEYFYRHAAYYDKEWPEEYFIKIIKFIDLILRDDDRLYRKFDSLPVELKKSDIDRPTLLSIQHFIGSLRIHPISNIDLLLKQLNKKETDMDTLLNEYLREKIADFVYSDDFHEETAFAELFLTKELKQKLCTFIITQYRDALYDKLISGFWRLADFVRIEDQSETQEERIFPLLVKEPGEGRRQAAEYYKHFRVIQNLMRKHSVPSREFVKNEFNRFWLDPGEKDIDVVLKCLLIEHSSDVCRRFIIERIEFKKLWDIIAYSKTPPIVLKEIAQHLRRTNDADRMKVFFSLTLLHLINALFEDLYLSSQHQIKRIIEIFYEFDFFAEGRYFRRLNDLTMRFKKKYGEDEIQIIEDARKLLDQDSAEKKDIKDKPPDCLKELPPAVQRKLARGGEYLKYFCTSTNNAVADEVYRYINYNNIGQFMSITAMNSVLFHKLLQRDELFKSRSAVYSALYHPKCTMDFAVRHAAGLSPDQRIKIASNPNINPDIKKYISSRFNIKIKAL